LLEIDLSRARLVVASACETGVVPSYELADEALALSTVFLGAGAAGVIASLWSVNDYATTLLMTRFYEHLVAKPDDVAGALRNAQLWLRDLSAFDEAAYAARHPCLTVQHTRHVSGESSPDNPAAAGSAGFRCPTMWAAFVFSGA
jgi:CHAT domain-containing protein